MRRVDSASWPIAASVRTIDEAFSKPGAMEGWLAPNNMKGEMLSFDFREGGAYRMRLIYTDPAHAPGKKADDVDEVEVRQAKDVPEGIRQEDHVEGFRASLENLAKLVETPTQQETGCLN